MPLFRKKSKQPEQEPWEADMARRRDATTEEVALLINPALEAVPGIDFLSLAERFTYAGMPSNDPNEFMAAWKT